MQVEARCKRCARVRFLEGPPALAGVDFQFPEPRVVRPVRDAIPGAPRLFLTTNGTPVSSGRTRWLPDDSETLVLPCRSTPKHSPVEIDREQLIERARRARAARTRSFYV